MLDVYTVNPQMNSKHKPLPPTDGVRVSGGHLCEAEAPTEAAAETVVRQRRTGGGEKTNGTYTSPSMLKPPPTTSNI